MDLMLADLAFSASRPPPVQTPEEMQGAGARPPNGALAFTKPTAREAPHTPTRAPSLPGGVPSCTGLSSGRLSRLTPSGFSPSMLSPGVIEKLFAGNTPAGTPTAGESPRLLG